jgi:hypothetical protein
MVHSEYQLIPYKTRNNAELQMGFPANIQLTSAAEVCSHHTVHHLLELMFLGLYELQTEMFTKLQITKIYIESIQTQNT